MIDTSDRDICRVSVHLRMLFDIAKERHGLASDCTERELWQDLQIEVDQSYAAMNPELGDLPLLGGVN